MPLNPNFGDWNATVFYFKETFSTFFCLFIGLHPRSVRALPMGLQKAKENGFVLKYDSVALRNTTFIVFHFYTFQPENNCVSSNKEQDKPPGVTVRYCFRPVPGLGTWAKDHLGRSPEVRGQT